MKVAVDRDYLLGTLTDLVRINSINPHLDPTGAGEAEIAAYVADALNKLNLEVDTLESEPGRPSVVGTLKGTGGGRSLMLNGHVDTVAIDEMLDPFSATVGDGKMYGRGAYDMKCGLAACMTAVKSLIDTGVSLAGDVLVAAVADEEYASLGTAEVIKHHQVDAAIVTESTELEICIAHRGYIHIEVETIGRAAHGSRFKEGIDANMRMGYFLAELDKLEKDLRARKAHPLIGPPSLHAGVLKGGTGPSTYAASCKLVIERRTIPGETESQIVGELQTIIDRLTAVDPTFEATLKILLARNAFEVDPERDVVKVLQQSAKEVLGKQPELVGQPYWMDTALLSDAGVEAVAMGPIGAGAHSKEEWVDLDSVIQMAEVLAQVIQSYCQ
ncbi:MAG: ArgE/DapE family deacylase [Anaerolineales bacterium]|nr:ArgE/DapE family deacylase [Anaerolineales bacterium]